MDLPHPTDGASKFASTPQPPYYAVIFTIQLSGDDPEAYAATGKRMVQLASEQPGYLGAEGGKDDGDGFKVYICYWESLAAMEGWYHHSEHREAQKQGKAAWFRRYRIRIAKIEKEYGSA